MSETMKNQPSQSHWWWLDNNSTVKRSPWLQSTLTELNEKTKAMLKLIEGDADSFAQRAEMFYKKRPELVSMVEDFYKTHRLLAERYDHVKSETGTRLLTPSASFKHSPSEKLVSFDEHGYDSYSEICDGSEVSVESNIDDPEHDEVVSAKFVEYIAQEEVKSVAANEVMKLMKEIERLSEEKKAHKDQMKQKDDILDELMKLREDIEQLRKENKAHKDELKLKDTIGNGIVMKLREELERLKNEDETQKDIICDEVMKLRKEIERLKKQNEAQKIELKQKDTICDEVMKLREKIERLEKENEAQKDELKQKDTISDEVMKLREEIKRLEKENEAQKDELKQKDTICNEVMKLKEELERHKKENEAQIDELKQTYTIWDEVMMLKEERESFREENRTQKDDLKQKDIEKIEVIRQLSSTIDVLKQENLKMRSFIAKESAKKWKTPFEFNKLVGTFSKKLFNGIPKNKPSIVAL